MIFVEVMYSDFSRKRVSLEQIHTLPRTDVLFIILTTDEKPRTRSNLVHRMWGKDFYAIKVDSKRILLDKWDEEDAYLHVRTFRNPHVLKRYRKTRLRLPEDAVVFEGGYVPPDKWEEAKRIFEEEMY